MSESTMLTTPPDRMNRLFSAPLKMFPVMTGEPLRFMTEVSSFAKETPPPPRPSVILLPVIVPPLIVIELLAAT